MYDIQIGLKNRSRVQKYVFQKGLAVMDIYMQLVSQNDIIHYYI